MNINIYNSGLGNIGMGRGMADASRIVATPETVDGASVSSRATFNVSGFASGAQPAGLASAEPVAEIPDVALSRDDALGRLVGAAFNLPPPPMPAFA